MASLPHATVTATVVGRLLRVVSPDPSAGLDWLRTAGLARQNAKRPRIQDASGAPLVQLSLEEGFFLAFEAKSLRILSSTGVQLDAPSAERLFAELQPRFAAYAAAYAHFRRAGWEVTSGLKYGMDYLLYPQESAHAGGHVHAPFSVVVHVPGGASPSAAVLGSDDGWGGQHDLSWKTIQGYSRLSCQVRACLARASTVSVFLGAPSWRAEPRLVDIISQKVFRKSLFQSQTPQTFVN